MIATNFKCDGPNCDAVRGPSNHWLLVMIRENDGPVFQVRSWNESQAHMEVQHVCGSACAHKLLDRYLESLR